MPQHASGSRVKSEGIVGRSDVHDSANDYRNRFEHLAVARMEYPGSTEVVDIRSSYLTQTAVAAAAVVAVIRRPIFADRQRQKVFVRYTHQRSHRRSATLRGGKFDRNASGREPDQKERGCG